MRVEHLSIPVGAGNLHAERVGRGGEPVVLIHGFGTCAFLWRKVAPRLANAGYTVLSIDLLGYGESDRPHDAAYGLTSQAEYLDRAMTALRIPAATIVAQDIGCIAALALAARRPRQIHRLALLGSPDPMDLPPNSVRSLQRDSAREAIGANTMFGVMPMMSRLLTRSVSTPGLMSELLVARYAVPFIGRNGVTDLLMLASATERGGEDQIDSAAVATDILIVRGESDSWLESAESYRLEARLKSAETRVVSIPGAGHLVPEDAPEALASILIEWISDGAGDGKANGRGTSVESSRMPRP